MKHAETIAPVAAALSALATLACCLPIAFAAGTATAGLAVIAGSYRWWFLGTSIALLAVGAVRDLVAPKACSVSFIDDRGVRHSVRVRAESLFEAAAAALAHRRAKTGGENHDDRQPSHHPWSVHPGGRRLRAVSEESLRGRA